MAPGSVVRMKVFVAGATGAIGKPLLRELIDAGHTVAGMTRSDAKVAQIEAAGAQAYVADAFDADAVAAAVADFTPDVIVNQLTDLPSSAALLPFKIFGLNKVRIVGTDNLLAAAAAAGVNRVVAQSIAFDVPGIARKGVDHIEKVVPEAGGVVLKYGQFYGPGTWSDTAPKKGPAVSVDAAAAATVDHLTAKPGVYTITD